MGTALHNDELKLIKGIKPKLVIPICCSIICFSPNIAILIYFLENIWNARMIIVTIMSLFCNVLLVVSWVTYFTSMDNYKDMIKKYSDANDNVES